MLFSMTDLLIATVQPSQYCAGIYCRRSCSQYRNLEQVWENTNMDKLILTMGVTTSQEGINASILKLKWIFSTIINKIINNLYHLLCHKESTSINTRLWKFIWRIIPYCFSHSIIFYAFVLAFLPLLVIWIQGITSRELWVCLEGIVFSSLVDSNC